MEKFSAKISKLLDWAIENRNMLFLAVCLAIHIVYMFVFDLLDIWPLALLNLVSTCFYSNLLFIKKDTSEKSMAATYFEILFFAFLNELALGPDYGFFLYIIGMAAAVFYLVPSYGNKRFIYQIIGMAAAVAVEALARVAGVVFLGEQSPAEPYKAAFYLINIVITTTIGLGATFFYSRRTEGMEATLRYNMDHDALTGLYNRRFFERQMALVPDNKREQYIISMVDIDFFKKVNDTYGHEAGDIVLVKVAACLMDIAGGENLAVRWGGEEFILYFPQSSPEKIQPLMEALRQRVESMEIKAAGKKIRVTITVGIGIGIAESNYETVIKNADEKLYLGKQRGRNRVIL